MWWSNYDRSLNHDQIFFDKLYKSLYPDVRSHITIVPPDALNSIPPPMKYQQSHHSVLHMMGESSALRKAVFQKGWDNICSSPQSIPNQLNLSQPILRSLALQLFYTRLDDIITTINSTSVNINTDSDTNTITQQNIDRIFNTISEGREIVLQIKILNNDNTNDNTNDTANDNKMKSILNTMYSSIQHTYLNLLECRNDFPIDVYKHMEIQFLNLYAIVGTLSSSSGSSGSGSGSSSGSSSSSSSSSGRKRSSRSNDVNI